MSDLDQRIASLSPEKRELLLQRLNEQRRANSASKVIPRRSAAIKQLPLSFAQEALWLVHQLASESTAYNLPHALRLVGPLNLAALEQSLQKVVDRHETLRTTFRILEGHPRQIIAPTLKVPFEVVDVASLPEPERAARVRQHMETEIARPFNLAQGPLLRVTLLRLAEEEAILLLLLHHTISDEWSQSVLVRELTTLYRSLVTNEPSPLADLPIQYADYVLWQREQLQGETLERLLDYWKKRLSGAPAVLELPTDHPRPVVQSFRGAQVPFHLSAEVVEQLRMLGQQEQTSLFMTLLAAFQVLLARYTGRDDILVGSPIANRNRPETVGMIGYLVNMLVLRTDCSGQPSFRQLLRQVRATALEAYAHQEAPFEKLVEALRPERNLSYNPLFQILFQLENAGPTSFETAGLTWQTMETRNASSQFDLQLTIREAEDSLAGHIKYNTELFAEASIERLVGHWQTLLAGLAGNPDQSIATAPLLTPAEQRQLLESVPEEANTIPPGPDVPQWFEEQAARTPEALAVRDEGGQQLTYRALNARANQLAAALRERGVGPETLVGLCLERTVDLLVGLLGVLKAGGAYVPLDPTYPAERLAFMLEDSQVAVLVTQQALRASLPLQADLPVLLLDPDQAALWAQPQANLPPSATLDNLAYVIYTSGSTGKPKGVQVLRRGLVNFLRSMQQEPGLSAQDRLLAVTTLSFDIAGLELLLPLLVGAQVQVISRETAATGTRLIAALEECQATVMQATPVTWRLLLAAGWQGRPGLKALCGGEALPLDLARQLLARCGSLWNLYGPTETTIWSTVRQITTADAVITIGHPIANTQVYVLDGQGQPVPVGVPGELYIGGAGLARGYLHRPELTAERFIPHPFSQALGARLYRTGDLARFLPTGDLEHLGRLDQQVKLRGFRIELGEIEAVLSQHPAVREAVVVARESGSGDKRLIAYVIPQPGQEVNWQVVRPFLKERLPDYMIPAACLTLETFPQTPNGKIDRKALPAPEWSERAEREGYVPPTLIEHYELIGIWEDLLEVRPIGIRDSFFDLGGHSLLAAQLINRVELVFSKKIPLAAFYADPTVERLTHLLEQQETIPDMPMVPVQTGGAKRSFFFLHGDLIGGAWYCFPLAHRLGPEQPFYAIQPYKFDGLRVPPTLEEQAASYIKTLQTIQPEGPYLLGGFCFGGLLAYEMARQLQAQGQKVDFLLLINTTSPASLPLQLFRRALERLRVGERRAFYTFLWARHLYKYARFSEYRWATNKATQKGGKRSLALPSLRAIFPPLAFLGQSWGSVNSWLLSGYQPGSYPGKITFFWVKEEVTEARKWRKVPTDPEAIDLQIIPGNHLGCLQEHLPALAEQLSWRLNQAQAAPQSEPV